MLIIMAYTALKKMQTIQEGLFNRGCGPIQPDERNQSNDFDLKSLAIRFLHTRCEGLGFDDKIEASEKKTGVYQGTSLLPNQIPYNMQMDLNRLCLERELE